MALLTASNILFIVNGGAAVAERSRLQHRTWCNGFRCVFVTDEGFVADDGMLSIVVGAASNHSWACNTNDKYWLAQLRFMQGLRAVQKLSRAWHVGVLWYTLVDDDSFVFTTSLLALLNRMDPSRALYMGDFSDVGTGSFACGGGGFVFSRAAFQVMDLDVCLHKFAHGNCSLPRGHDDRLVSNDVIVARCTDAFGVRAVRNFSCGTCGRYNATFTRAAIRDGRAHLSLPRSQSPHDHVVVETARTT